MDMRETMEFVTLDDYDDLPGDETPSGFQDKRIKDLELLLRQALDFIRGTSKIPPCDLAFMIEATIESGELNDTEADDWIAAFGVDTEGAEGGLETPVD